MSEIDTSAEAIDALRLRLDTLAAWLAVAGIAPPARETVAAEAERMIGALAAARKAPRDA